MRGAAFFFGLAGGGVLAACSTVTAGFFVALGVGGFGAEAAATDFLAATAFFVAGVDFFAAAVGAVVLAVAFDATFLAAAVFLAGCFTAATFLAGCFTAATFLAGCFTAATFLAGAGFPAAVLTGDFLLEAFVATVVPVDFLVLADLGRATGLVAFEFAWAAFLGADLLLAVFLETALFLLGLLLDAAAALVVALVVAFFFAMTFVIGRGDESGLVWKAIW